MSELLRGTIGNRAPATQQHRLVFSKHGGWDKRAKVRRFWIFIGVVLVLGAIPALYPSIWRGEGDWALAAGELHTKTSGTLRARLGHALEDNIIEQFSICITQKTIAWLQTSGCPYLTDSLEEQAVCIEQAGLKAASQSIQLQCARDYSPAEWTPLRSLFVSDAMRTLENGSLEATAVQGVADCAADKIISALNASSCRPIAIFEGGPRCFNADRRSRELRAALTACMSETVRR